MEVKTQDISIKLIEANKGQIEGLPKNPRLIKDHKFEKLVKSIEENPEMLNMRELLVYPHGGKFIVIGGNMRLEALKKLGYKSAPCKVIPQDATVEQLRAYTIKDNNGYGEWDFDLLAGEWDTELLDDWGVDLPAWEEEEEKTLEDVSEDDFNEEDEDITERCQRGDVWQLGEHRLMCGDSTNADDVAKLMGGAMADVVFTDPPYGMKKENEGVLNDNLNYNDLLLFNKKWIPLSFSFLKNNGSWYCWGIDEPLMDIYSNILRPMRDVNQITFRNLLTWDKAVGFGQNSAEQRCYSIADEKCLFVMCGVQGYKNFDNYIEAWEPVRTYLRNEAEKVGLNASRLKEICGVGMFSHWFSKSQFELIGEKYYKTLQEHYKNEAFKKDYEEIKKGYVEVKRGKEYEEKKKEHEEKKKEYYAARAYFDNTHDNMNNVWHFERARFADSETFTNNLHATPKPIALCARAIKSSARQGEIVLDLFGGSGSTLIACERTQRKCCMMELSDHYCDVIIARWEKETGKEAVKL